MTRHLRSNLWLLGLSLLLCSVLYPGALLLIGQTLFPRLANGSIVLDKDGKAVGSRLIAQPFSKDEYFQPRPSAASYNGAASGASNWGANNYKLRDRVARQIGPIVKYRGGAKKGQLVGPDIENWYKVDRSQGEVGFIAQWEKAHPGLIPDPKKELIGAEIQSIYFDAWLMAHPRVDLELIPSDLVMASGSGLDPNITLKGALYQLDRVAGAWAAGTGQDLAALRKEIDALLEEGAEAPLGGLAGVKLINVLEVNLALRDRYGAARK